MTTGTRAATKSELLEQLHRIRDCQMGDLRRALFDAQANFLVAGGCMNIIEFLGGLQNGELGDPDGRTRNRFLAGVKFLAGEYAAFGGQHLYGVRCGLNHQYLYEDPRYSDLQISAAVRKPALQSAGATLTLNVGQLVDDLGFAWDRLLRLVSTDADAEERVRGCLARLPRLG